VRTTLQKVIQSTTPELVIHGHYHEKRSYTYTYPNPKADQANEPLWLATRVYGLGADVSPLLSDGLSILRLDPLANKIREVPKEIIQRVAPTPSSHSL
jgi:hypothetical protein